MCSLGALCCVCAVSWGTWPLFTGVPARCVVSCVWCARPLGSCCSVCWLRVLCCVLCVRCPRPLGSCSSVCWLRVLCCVLCVRCPGPLGFSSTVCALGVLCCVCCVVSLRGAHSSIWTALFVAGRGCVPSGVAQVHPDGGCSEAGRGWVRCRTLTRSSGWRLFHTRLGLGPLLGARTSFRTAAVLPGTFSRAVFLWVLCALSGFAASGARCCLAPVRVPWLWPAACLSGVPRGPAWCAAPHPIRSLSVLRSAFPTQWCLSPRRGPLPPDLLSGYAGHAETDREPDSLSLPLVPAEARALGPLRLVPIRGPAMGSSLAGPSVVGLGLLAVRWFACVDPGTDAFRFLFCPSFDGGVGWRTGAVWCGRGHLPFRVGGRHAQVPCVCACARSSWPGRAGLPPGRVLVHLTLPVAASFFCSAWPPPGCVCRFPVCLFTPHLFLPFSLRPGLSCSVRFPAPGDLGLGAPCPPSRAPAVLFCVFPLRLLGLVFVSFHPAFPPPPPLPILSSAFSAAAAPPYLFCGPPLLGSPCAPFFSGVLCCAAGSMRVVFCLWSCSRAVSLVVSSCCIVPIVVCCLVLVCGAVCRSVLRVAPPGFLLFLCRVVLFCSFCAVACCVVPSGTVCRPVVLCFPALCFVVFHRSVCSVLRLSCRGVLVRAVVRRCALCCVCVLCVSSGVVLRVPCSLRSVRCCAALCWCVCLVLFVWLRCLMCLVLWCVAVCCVVCCGVLCCGAGSGCPRLSFGGLFWCRCPCLAAWHAPLWLV